MEVGSCLGGIAQPYARPFGAHYAHSPYLVSWNFLGLPHLAQSTWPWPAPLQSNCRNLDAGKVNALMLRSQKSYYKTTISVALYDRIDLLHRRKLVHAKHWKDQISVFVPNGGTCMALAGKS